MNSQWGGLRVAILGILALVLPAPAEIVEGMSRAELVAELGEPGMQIDRNGVEILSYLGMSVEVTGGVVTFVPQDFNARVVFQKKRLREANEAREVKRALEEAELREAMASAAPGSARVSMSAPSGGWLGMAWVAEVSMPKAIGGLVGGLFLLSFVNALILKWALGIVVQVPTSYGHAIKVTFAWSLVSATVAVLLLVGLSFTAVPMVTAGALAVLSVIMTAPIVATILYARSIIDAEGESIGMLQGFLTTLLQGVLTIVVAAGLSVLGAGGAYIANYESPALTQAGR